MECINVTLSNVSDMLLEVYRRYTMKCNSYIVECVTVTVHSVTDSLSQIP
jgi:hypothetical protein